MAVATINWPSTLPVKPLADGYQEEPQNAVIRTEMEMGTPKQRRRFTAVSDYIQCKFVLTKAQLTDFKTFWTATSKFGSLAFNWTHPTTGAACVARFMGAYQITGNGPYRVLSLKIEIIP